MSGPIPRPVATAIVAVVIGIGAVCAANGARRVGQPFPGFLVPQNRNVLSIGRAGWSLERAPKIVFAQVVAVEGRPVGAAEEIQAHAAAVPVGTPVTYRFRKYASVFTAAVETQVFTLADYLSLYGTYALAGLAFAIAGLWVQRRAVAPPTANAFFVLCQVAAVALVTGGDVYGPYWFTPLYLAAHCLAPAAILHLAATYPEALGAASPWRRSTLALLYGVFLGMGILLNLAAGDPSLFLPLLYAVYLLLANAILLYVARLAIAIWGRANGTPRPGLKLAAAGVLVAALVPGAIFVTYPALHGAVSPLLVAGTLPLFPLLTAAAIARSAGAAETPPERTSVRLRLSLLFLGAIETAFLVGVTVFWLGASWRQFIDDLTLNERQHALAEHVLSPAAALTPADIDSIDALVQSADEHALVTAAGGGGGEGGARGEEKHAGGTTARAALLRGAPEAAHQAIAELAGLYTDLGRRLRLRRRWLARVEAALVVALLGGAILQSVAFMLAIRRWLIRPVDRLAATASILATGDLSHRARLDSAHEFGRLADAINAMAASLSRIQQRVISEREMRHVAAGAARDAERRRLARELHDGVLQDLSAVKLRLEGEARRSTQAELRPAIDGVIEVIANLRSVVDDLRPPDLTRVPLREAIEAHARVLTRGRGIGVVVELPDTVEIPDWAARDVFRIAQEAMANAIRHAAPAALMLRLYQSARASVLEVEDDGAGFDIDAVALGSGIVGMRERAAAIGADLDIDSAPGRGTLVRLAIPVAAVPGAPAPPAGGAAG